MTATVTLPAPGSPTSELRSLARHGTANLAGLVCSGVMSFVLALVLARGLGPRGYGALTTATALFTILVNVGELGADTGFLRGLPRLLVHGRQVDVPRMILAGFVPVAIYGVFVGLSVFAFAPELAHIIVREAVPGQVDRYLAVLGPFIIVGSLLPVVLAALRAFGRMKAYVAIQNVLVPLVRPGLAVLALTMGAHGAGIALAWALPLCAALVIAVWQLRTTIRSLPIRAGAAGSPTPVRTVARDFWGFTAARTLAGAAAILVTWINLLMLGGLRSAHDAGVYAGVMRYVLLGTFGLQAIRVVIGPQISRLIAQGRPRETESVFQTATCWLLGLSGPYFLLLAVFAMPLLHVFGAGYAAGRTALVILCLAELVDICTGNVTLVLLMGGRSLWNLLNIGFGLVLTVALGFTLIPRYGVTGAAIAWAAAIVFENVAATCEVALFMRLRPFGSSMLRILLLAGGCYGLLPLVTRMVFGDTASALALTAVSGTAIYAGFLWQWRRELRLDVLFASLTAASPTTPNTGEAR